MYRSNSIMTIVAAVLCAAASIAVSTPAHAQDARIGVRAAGVWSALPQPDDARGEPTLMSGTAFSGTGFGGGLWASIPLTEFSSGALNLEAGALYSVLRGSGFEQRGDARREALLKTRVIRVPILAVYATQSADSTSRVGLGVEPLFGIWSGAEVTTENTSETPEPLFTTPVTHLGLSALLGYDIAVSDGIAVPLELRVTYDPMVGRSTLERFQDFDSASNPGEYEAAFRWQLLFSTGVSFDI